MLAVWLVFGIWQPAAVTGAVWLVGVVALMGLAIARRTLPTKRLPRPRRVTQYAYSLDAIALDGTA